MKRGGIGCQLSNEILLCCHLIEGCFIARICLQRDINIKLLKFFFSFYNPMNPRMLWWTWYNCVALGPVARTLLCLKTVITLENIVFSKLGCFSVASFNSFEETGKNKFKCFYRVWMLCVSDNVIHCVYSVLFQKAKMTCGHTACKLDCSFCLGVQCVHTVVCTKIDMVRHDKHILTPHTPACLHVRWCKMSCF